MSAHLEVRSFKEPANSQKNNITEYERSLRRRIGTSRYWRRHWIPLEWNTKRYPFSGEKSTVRIFLCPLFILYRTHTLKNASDPLHVQPKPYGCAIQFKQRQVESILSKTLDGPTANGEVLRFNGMCRRFNKMSKPVLDFSLLPSVNIHCSSQTDGLFALFEYFKCESVLRVLSVSR